MKKYDPLNQLIISGLVCNENIPLEERIKLVQAEEKRLYPNKHKKEVKRGK